MNKNKIVVVTIITIILIVVLVTLFVIDKINRDNSKEDLSNLSSINILATFYPQYIALLNITDGVTDVKVDILNTQNVGCLHEYSLTTEDMKKIETANLIVINGAKMENGFLSSLNSKDKPIVDSSKGIELIQSNNEENSHTYLSIKLYIEQVKNIASELRRLDPQNTDVYTKNETDYVSKLNELEIIADSSLSDIKNRKTVVFHSSFDYLAKDYDIEIVGYITEEPEEEPSAKELAGTIDLIKSNNIKSIFAEKIYNIRLAETVAKDSNSKLYTLDTITGGELDKDAYIYLMKENIKTIKEALND